MAHAAAVGLLGSSRAPPSLLPSRRNDEPSPPPTEALRLLKRLRLLRRTRPPPPEHRTPMCAALSRRGSGKWNGYGTHRKQQRHQQREATIKVVPMSGPSHTPQCLPAMASQPRGGRRFVVHRFTATRTIAPHPPQDDGGRDP